MNQTHLFSKDKPMIVLIDSREKTPWGFSPRVDTLRCKLDAGDYSLQGFENRVSVERKHLNDFVNTLIHQRRRFYRELEILHKYEFAYIVVEGDLRDIFDRRYTGTAEPMAVLGLSNALMIDFGVPVLFWGRRQVCSAMVENLFRLLWRRQNPEADVLRNEHE